MVGMAALGVVANMDIYRSGNVGWVFLLVCVLLFSPPFLYLLLRIYANVDADGMYNSHLLQLFALPLASLPLISYTPRETTTIPSSLGPLHQPPTQHPHETTHLLPYSTIPTSHLQLPSQS